MTDKIYDVSVALSVPQLKQSSHIYHLENIENIVEQLFGITPSFKASIGHNEEGRLCVAQGQMLFNLDIVGLINDKIQDWSIFGDIKLSEFEQNQSKIQGDLVDTVLVGYYKDQKGCGMMEIVARLPVVKVSLKKIETQDEFNATAKRNT